MKKFLILVLLALFTFTLYSCNKDKDEFIYDKEVNIPHDTVFAEGEITSYYVTTIECETIKNDENNISYSRSSTNISNEYFGAYRYTSVSIGLMLYPNDNNYKNTTYHGREGSFFNVRGLGGINSIEITYTTTLDSDISKPINPNITYGSENNCTDYLKALKKTEKGHYVTETINTNKSGFQFFSVNTGDYIICIDKITIYYDNDPVNITQYEPGSGSNKTRINPIKYSGTLVPGESKVILPTAIEYNEKTGTYVTKDSIILTYYTLDYVLSHPEVKDEAAITDPMQVCMYYTAFGTWPANYDYNHNRVNAVFGNKGRMVSQYRSTGGYARSVPWRKTGYYYELDIDVDGKYSTASRGIGRVVVWESGFNASGYDNSPVCLYTDDHYNTWLEYLNDGTWSNRFNGEGIVSGVSHSSAITVTLN